MKIKMFQEGGSAPMPAPAPAPAGGQDAAMAQIQQIAAQIIQEMGPDAAAMLAQLIMEMLQSAAPAPGQEVAFQKCGGKLKKVAKKSSK